MTPDRNGHEWRVRVATDRRVESQCRRCGAMKHDDEHGHVRIDGPDPCPGAPMLEAV